MTTAGGFQAGTAVVPATQVEISVQCRNLADLDVLSKSDPMCVMFMKDIKTNTYYELGRTETLDNQINPDFATKFTVTYYFEELQSIKFELYDVDSASRNLKDHDFIGSLECTLGELVGAPGEIGETFERPKEKQWNHTAIWSNYQVAFGFAGFLLLLFNLCVVVAVRRKSNMKRRARQRERHCGLMTAAIYDIMSQSQLASATNATESGSSAIVVEPVKPPSYEEINREAAVPQDPPPSYGESIRESVRESMKDYPEHFCQSIIRKY